MINELFDLWVLHFNGIRHKEIKQLSSSSQCVKLSSTFPEQSPRMTHHSTAKIFGANVEEGLMWCEPEDKEYSIDTGCESLRMKLI